eukprot:gene12963-17381_t
MSAWFKKLFFSLLFLFSTISAFLIHNININKLSSQYKTRNTLHSTSYAETEDIELNRKIMEEESRLLAEQLPVMIKKIAYEYGIDEAQSARPVWNTDEDTSEIEVGSSADLKRKVDFEQKAAEEEKKLREIIKQQAKQSILETKKKIDSTAKQSSEVVVAVVKSIEQVKVEKTVTPPKVEEKKGAFDIGLIIAFPFIIGTLLLFFLFPFIRDQISTSLPPPMSY